MRLAGQYSQMLLRGRKGGANFAMNSESQELGWLDEVLMGVVCNLRKDFFFLFQTSDGGERGSKDSQNARKP